MGNSLFVNVNSDYIDYFEYVISSVKETDISIDQLYKNSSNASGLLEVGSLRAQSDSLDSFVNWTDISID